jgi:hypothetical protein
VNRRLRILPLLIATAFATVPLLIASPTPASANHSWGGYHWARTSNPFTLKVGDNVSGAWDSVLNTTISDWSTPPAGSPDVLNLTKQAGASNPKNCRATSGQVEVCNSRYGNNGWLGIAQIWVNGSHITQGTVKLNDTYHNSAPYNAVAWRNLVSCQEVGHTLGLDHQDENFSNPNLNTCMDYTSSPDSNQHPNAHDFAQLESIYAHLDSTTTIGSTLAPAPGRSGTAADEGPNNPADFGQSTGRRDGFGRNDLFVKSLPDGRQMFTHVFWTLQGHGRP